MKKLYEEENIKSIADSIRTKTGTTDKLKLADMSDRIDTIDLETYQNIVDKTITSINLPNVTSVGEDAFYNCTGLTSVNLPNVTSVGAYGFRGCTGLKEKSVLDFPNLEHIGDYAFYECLTYCGGLALRRTDKVCTLDSYWAFGGSNIVTPAFVFVPKSLLDSYKKANQWSMLVAVPKFYQIKALEDYTVDGTVTGDIDLSKVPWN